MMPTTTVNKYSEELLLQVKMNQSTSTIRNALAKLSKAQLIDELNDDDHKKAFWINIYNAYYQILRQETDLIKPAIYRDKLINIMGKMISLDTIEHGLLRRNRFKYSFGFFGNLCTKPFIKKHMVDRIDYRIHFALNCGAQSCPPIAFYHPDRIALQLDMATQSFLEGETSYDDHGKVVTTSALLKWFYGDFGGRNGINAMYSKQLSKDISQYTIKYKDYSWEDQLHNFEEDDSKI